MTSGKDIVVRAVRIKYLSSDAARRPIILDDAARMGLIEERMYVAAGFVAFFSFLMLAAFPSMGLPSGVLTMAPGVVLACLLALAPALGSYVSRTELAHMLHVAAAGIEATASIDSVTPAERTLDPTTSGYPVLELSWRDADGNPRAAHSVWISPELYGQIAGDNDIVARSACIKYLPDAADAGRSSSTMRPAWGGSNGTCMYASG